MHYIESSSTADGLSVDPELETQIRLAEINLGATKPATRLQETLLVVDRPLIDTSVITDPKNKHPERAFGHEQWLGHLTARQILRDYGDQPLTLELMRAVHKAYAKPFDSARAGELLYSGGYVSGSSEDKTLGYVAMTDTSIRAVRANPYVTFLPAPNEDLSKGWLAYGSGMNAISRAHALRGICNWYNTARQTYTNRILLAAQLQRRIVSLHPFDLGVNGRPSRALQNWSLMNSDMSPSAPYDFDNDVVVSLRQWQSEVATGMRRYQRVGQLGMLGHTDPVVLLDLQLEQQYFQNTLRHKMEPPAPLKPGSHHDRNACVKFMTALRTGVAHEQAIKMRRATL